MVSCLQCYLFLISLGRCVFHHFFDLVVCCPSLASCALATHTDPLGLLYNNSTIVISSIISFLDIMPFGSCLLVLTALCLSGIRAHWLLSPLSPAHVWSEHMCFQQVLRMPPSLSLPSLIRLVHTTVLIGIPTPWFISLLKNNFLAIATWLLARFHFSAFSFWPSKNKPWPIAPWKTNKNPNNSIKTNIKPFLGFYFLLSLLLILFSCDPVPKEICVVLMYARKMSVCTEWSGQQCSQSLACSLYSGASLLLFAQEPTRIRVCLQPPAQQPLRKHRVPSRDCWFTNRLLLRHYFTLGSRSGYLQSPVCKPWHSFSW